MKATWFIICTLPVQSFCESPTRPSTRASPHTYDYVIVGGGTAGLVVANRLSENPNITVALIEAGGLYETGDPLLSSTPAGDVYFCGSSSSSTNSNVDWNFVTTPQIGASNREVHYARGKCLGGSSARNFMIYQRGTIGSYKAWADAVEDQSYEFDNLLPYFKKSVQFTPPKSGGGYRAANATAEYNPNAFSNTGGPLEVSYANYASPFSSYIQGSLNEIGLDTVEDFNSGSLMGTQYCASTIDPSNEARSSSQTSFLNAAQSRSNLHVFSQTLAKQILFNEQNTATGVRVTSGLANFTLSAEREVIVSAGAFHSPQLLQVSGIGDATLLQQFDIPVLSDLSGVGQNMIDHVFFGPTYRVNVQTFTRLANDLGYVVSQFLTGYSKQQGPETNPVCDYLGWEKVPEDLRSRFTAEAQAQLATFPADWPEIEYLSAPGYVGNFSDLPTTQPKDGYQYATILAAIVAPLSRGSVNLTSNDTSDLPAVNPGWLTSPVDQQVAVAAFKRTRQAFASQFMSEVLVEEAEYWPGPHVQTDVQILKVIQDSLMTVWHASGTNKMGPRNDPYAVVDTAGRVYGVSNLRVVDGSIFPLLPPGHPQSTIYALAEKISDGILADF